MNWSGLRPFGRGCRCAGPRPVALSRDGSGAPPAWKQTDRRSPQTGDHGPGSRCCGRWPCSGSRRSRGFRVPEIGSEAGLGWPAGSNEVEIAVIDLLGSRHSFPSKGLEARFPPRRLWVAATCPVGARRRWTGRLRHPGTGPVGRLRRCGLLSLPRGTSALLGPDDPVPDVGSAANGSTSRRRLMPNRTCSTPVSAENASRPPATAMRRQAIRTLAMFKALAILRSDSTIRKRPPNAC